MRFVLLHTALRRGLRLAGYRNALYPLGWRFPAGAIAGRCLARPPAGDARAVACPVESLSLKRR